MVKLFVAVTDRAWFEFLSREPREEVNFWQPSLDFSNVRGASGARI